VSYNPEIHHRRSIRLRGWDYASAGAYFLTICVKNRECLFGNIVNGEMRLNPYGCMVVDVWNNLPNHFPTVALDAFVVMPNHVHGIIVLNKNNMDGSIVGADFKSAPTDTAQKCVQIKYHTLGDIIRGFKTFSARRINELRATPGMPLWQRNYHEHIIRDGSELFHIQRYIENNPKQWTLDSENPFTPSSSPNPTPSPR
jgi:putative transposase